MSNEEFKQRFLEFSKPFIDSITGIYKTMLSTDIKPGKPIIKDSPNSLGEYSAIMGINGKVNEKPFRGTLVISWPLECYLNSSKQMLGEEFTEINDEIADLGMEICNMTMGGAKSMLAEKGFSIDLSLPTAVRGKDVKIHVEDKVLTIVTPFESNLGKFFVEVNFNFA